MYGSLERNPELPTLFRVFVPRDRLDLCAPKVTCENGVWEKRARMGCGKRGSRQKEGPSPKDNVTGLEGSVGSIPEFPDGQGFWVRDVWSSSKGK